MKNQSRTGVIALTLCLLITSPALLASLPYYPGYEWKIVGDNLVLIALSTAVVTAIINNVFH